MERKVEKDEEERKLGEWKVRKGKKYYICKYLKNKEKKLDMNIEKKLKTDISTND